MKIGSPIVKELHVRDGILEAAAEVGADMIVMGTHGRRGVARVMIGSVTEEIIRRAQCPVLTVRATQAQLTTRLDAAATEAARRRSS